MADNKKYEYLENQGNVVAESTVVSTAPAVFTGYQMQILESIAHVHDDKVMRDIRNIIAEYFSNKALDAMDALCENGQLSTSEIEAWQTEHMRTPYN